MRFLDLLTCGRKAFRQLDHAAPGGTSGLPFVPANPPPRSSGAAAPAAADPGHQNRRRRPAGAPGSGAASQWRPSLGAISENGVRRAAAAAEGKAGEQRSSSPMTGKAKPATVVRARGRDYHDDYRHFTASSVVPAFVPTPFLF